RPFHALALRAQGHSFSDSHRLRRAWHKDARTAHAHSRHTTRCYDVCLHSTVPIGVVPLLEKRPKTLTVLLTRVSYLSSPLSSLSWWCACSFLSLRRSDYVPLAF